MQYAGLKTKIVCAHCRKETERPNRHVNFARKHGKPLYCDLSCASAANRNIKKFHEGRDFYNRQRHDRLHAIKKEINDRELDLQRRKRQSHIVRDVEFLPVGLCL